MTPAVTVAGPQSPAKQGRGSLPATLEDQHQRQGGVVVGDSAITLMLIAVEPPVKCARQEAGHHQQQQQQLLLRKQRRRAFLCCFAPPAVSVADDDGEPRAQAQTVRIHAAAGAAAAAAAAAARSGSALNQLLAADSSAASDDTSAADDFEEFWDARSQASSFDLGGYTAYQADVLLGDDAAEGADQPGKQHQRLLQQQRLAASPQPQQQEQQQQQQRADGGEGQDQAAPPRWVPNPPLMFARGEALEFVPVPAVTGFAGKWDIDLARTDPFPQPIDLMIGASALVRRIHATVPGSTMYEDADTFKVTVQPTFMPKGIPSCHTELYDKRQQEKYSWWPRRDVVLGKAVSEVFYTADGTLILRSHTYPMWGKTPDYVVEDYFKLEQGGKVLVDRMCCFCTRTKRSAQQTQVAVKDDSFVPPASMP